MGLNQGPDEDDDDGNEVDEDIKYWPSIPDQCLLLLGHSDLSILHIDARRLYTAACIATNNLVQQVCLKICSCPSIFRI